MKYLKALSGAWSNLARHKLLSAFIVAVIPLLGRLLLLPLLPIPLPSAADEFANVLAGNTFAMGRWTNPTPPMWVHFETIYELMLPTYMSKYPPGQGAMLAIGRLLFGHPWWAVFLSIGVMCGLLTWMLQAWLPASWALLGGALAALHFGFVHYWVNSYAGGSLAAIGGLLVLGAVPRLKTRLRLSCAIAFAFGLMVLASTRPFEGLVLALVVAAALAVLLFRQEAIFQRRFARKFVLPSLLVMIPIAALLLAENKAVTGSALTFPQLLYQREIAVWRNFVWERPRQPPAYAHEKLRKYFVFTEGEASDAHEWGTLRGLIPGIRGRFWLLGGAFFPGLLYLPVALASLLVAFSSRVRWLGLTVLAVFAATALVRWFQATYLAPITGAMMAIHLQFFRYVRAVRWKGRRIGKILFSALLSSLVIMLLARASARSFHPAPPWAPMRHYITQRLESTAGKHLVLVRYDENHAPGDEWVYNEPDIPTAKVIWARSMSPALDRELIEYFRDRTAWEVDVDAKQPELVPKGRASARWRGKDSNGLE